MALNTSSREKDVLETQDDSYNRNNHIVAEHGNKTGFGRSNFMSSNKPTGARIGPVLSHLTAFDITSDSGSDILGKQIEMEVDNAIQYRTCSWQKVRSLHGLRHPYLGVIWSAATRPAAFSPPL